MTNAIPTKEALSDPLRLQALERTGLLDSDADAEFDRLTELARITVSADIALVSLVTDERQFFKSSCGLSEPTATARETPLSHSICQHVVESRGPLIIEDARKHPLVKDSLAVSELGVIAYLGIPLIDANGNAIGAFCAIQSVPRQWTEKEVCILTHLSGAVMSEIRLRELVQQSQAEKVRAKRNEERLAAILESTGEAIYGIDATGTCTFFNRSCAKLLGAEKDEDLLGKNMHELIHHTRKDGTPNHIDDCAIRKSCLHGKGVVVSDEVFWRIDGTSFPVEYSSFPKVSGGKITGSVVAFTNITKRLAEEEELLHAKDAAEKARRRAEYADRQKSRFLANVSHEIRTPMNAILGFSELLEGSVESPRARQYVSAIRSSGTALLALINDILDLSKIESGKLEVNPEPCDIREAVESVRLLLSQQAAEKNIDLQAEVALEVPDILQVDRLRLRQIILNLISNAIKFTDEGGVNVRAWTEKRALDEKHVDLYIAVADTGMGIPEEQLKSIFKPFEQVETVPDTIDEGTGLGLSIAMRLAKLMNGRIELESEVSEGSTFTLILKRIPISIDNTALDIAPPLECNLDLLEPAKVLVVDDNAFNRELAAGYFEDTHHSVHFANNGAKGLEVARKLDPDIILMDIRMPVMNGLEARELAKSDEALAGIPMIAVTASSMKDESIRLRRVFDGYIRKPFSRAELFSELSSFLSQGTAAEITLPGSRPETVAYQASAEEKIRWQPLAETLTHLQMSMWKGLRETMAIGEVTDFAKQLEKLGEDTEYQPLIGYAKTLREQSEGFALTSMETTMDAYPLLIEALQQAVAANQ